MGGQPLLSLVLPVYRVRPYLAACLDSALGTDASIEVIAVDDASDDGSGDLLDERAGADARLTVLHLAQNAGQGNARNLGLARAAGQYVWFVDADDLIAAGAMDAITERLVRITPDLLLIGYQDLYPDGETAPGAGLDLLGRLPHGCFRLSDAPSAINLTMTSWSKLFRREFLRDLAEPFRCGIHEDVPVSSAALLAGEIAVLDRVCYTYRRARTGSAMVTTASEHAAIFDSYHEVFAMLERRLDAADPTITPAVRCAVFERAIWHYSTVLSSGLVPRAERRAFFGRMHSDFTRLRPPGYRLPGGAKGAKFALIEANAYRLYELLEPVNRLRVSVRRRTGQPRSIRPGRSSTRPG